MTAKIPQLMSLNLVWKCLRSAGLLSPYWRKEPPRLTPATLIFLAIQISADYSAQVSPI